MFYQAELRKNQSSENRRQINLVVKDFDSPYDTVHSWIGFCFANNKTLESTGIPTLPGPPIIIQQNEPVAIVSSIIPKNLLLSTGMELNWKII